MATTHRGYNSYSKQSKWLVCELWLLKFQRKTDTTTQTGYICLTSNPEMEPLYKYTETKAYNIRSAVACKF